MTGHAARAALALAVLLVAATAALTQARAQMPGAGQWRSEILVAAHESSIDPDLLQSIVQIESRGNPAARGRAGEIGLCQLLPATARALGVDPYQPLDNLRGGARYLAQELAATGGSVPHALAAYNCGPRCRTGAAATWPATTRAYVGLVLAERDRLAASGVARPVPAASPVLPGLPRAGAGGGVGSRYMATMREE